MPRVVEPEVFLLAETRIINSTGGYGLQGFLNFLGVPDWRTDAASDAEELCEIAGKSCYLSFSTDLNKNLTRVGARKNAEYLQDGIIKTKHGSVLEHPSVTIAFVNVSRVFTHELVRHRAGAAYSQVSGRYVRTDELTYFLPTVIKQDKEASAFFYQAFATMEDKVVQLAEHFNIDSMKDFTLKKILTSAFRRLIGNGQGNHIVATFNHRALRHILELRTSIHAEEEIRVAFCKLWYQLSGRYHSIYSDAKIVPDESGPLFSISFEHEKV